MTVKMFSQTVFVLLALLILSRVGVSAWTASKVALPADRVQHVWCALTITLLTVLP